MHTRSTNLDLWTLVRNSPQLDPDDLVQALESEAHRKPHDFRTRLLLRDCFQALEKHWGPEVIVSRLSSEAAAIIQNILKQDLGKPGFATLEKRIMKHTDRETVLQFFRDLGDRVAGNSRLYLGGSGALILAGVLSRHTDDLDAVDEIPDILRSEHELLESLALRYGLRLTHFQSHYLPRGWEARSGSLGRFGGLEIYLIDVYDILLSKLFSNREKDLDDLRVLFQSLDSSVATQRLKDTCTSLLSEPKLRANAVRNWYIIFGDELPE